jgi:hypothetical protein
MAADWTIVQGDTAPVFNDTLTLADGTVPTLTGASIVFTLRSSAAAAPLTLTGTATIMSTSSGTVRYTPSAGDTAVAGRYLASWRVTFVDGSTMTFPTVGYLTVDVEANLTGMAATLVSLTDVKEYLGIASGDRNRDDDLLRAIQAVRPVVENITGPIVQTVYDEWHQGGGPIIQIRRRPSTSYDTTPVLTLLTADEYIGSALHPLTIVANPIARVDVLVHDRRDRHDLRLTGGGGGSPRSRTTCTSPTGRGRRRSPRTSPRARSS